MLNRAGNAPPKSEFCSGSKPEVAAMSASTPESDIGRTFPEVRFVPGSDICTATNHIHIEKLANYFVATILMPPSLRC